MRALAATGAFALSAKGFLILMTSFVERGASFAAHETSARFARPQPEVAMLRFRFFRSRDLGEHCKRNLIRQTMKEIKEGRNAVVRKVVHS